MTRIDFSNFDESMQLPQRRSLDLHYLLPVVLILPDSLFETAVNSTLNAFLLTRVRTVSSYQ